jgi:hypothetical protein
VDSLFLRQTKAEFEPKRGGSKAAVISVDFTTRLGCEALTGRTEVVLVVVAREVAAASFAASGGSKSLSLDLLRIELKY